MPPKKKVNENKQKSKKQEKNKIQIYCGNNAQNIDLIEGRKKIGTRHECLRRGVGIGLNIPLEEKLQNDYYSPIYKEKIYCGDKEDIPSEYDRFGSLMECQTKGVGVGLMKQKADRNEIKIYNPETKRWVLRTGKIGKKLLKEQEKKR